MNSSNVKRIARLEIPGGGQVVVQGNYAYIGHMKPPHGTSIIDVSDPKHSQLLATLMLPDAESHSHKARVVGEVMIVNVEQNNRHQKRKLAAASGKVDPYQDGGFRIYDIADRRKPRLLAYQKTYGFGVHRFDMDGRYAYISTEMEGYIGNILVIYDIQRPERPEEVARWWMPGQHLAGGEQPTWSGYKNRLHHTLRAGNQLWASVWHAGLRVIDVSDIRRPRTVGAYDYHPPFPEPTHTVLRVPFAVAGRQVAVVIDEEHDHVPGTLHAGLWVFDVGDLESIRPLSHRRHCRSDPAARSGPFHPRAERRLRQPAVKRRRRRPARADLSPGSQPGPRYPGI